MAFNVSTINPYVNETAMQLAQKAILTGRTVDVVRTVPGIKGTQTLNHLENTISVQNATCGFSSNGSVAISQVPITVTALEIKESLCEKTLEEYFIGQWMKPGSPKEEELGAILADSYVKKVKEAIELNIWKGEVGVYGKIDGFIHQLAALGTRVTAHNGSPDVIGGPFTSGTIISSVEAMVAAIPEAILEQPDLILFLSMGNYMLYTSALRTANLYHYDAQNGVNFEMMIPGTSIKIMGTHGLTGTNSMILTYAQNLIIGTDLVNEEEKFDIWYSRDNDEVRVNIQWKLGVAIDYPEFVVCNF